MYEQQCQTSTFTCVGLMVDRFMKIMSEKMFAQDEDEHIRQMFLAFDMQCMYQLTVVTMALSLVINHLRCFICRITYNCFHGHLTDHRCTMSLQ